MVTCVGSDAVKRAERSRILTFCMPCSTIPSGAVALGPVTALQSGLGVWGGRARSGEIGGVGAWCGPGWPDLPVKGSSSMAIQITEDAMSLETGNHVVADRPVQRG